MDRSPSHRARALAILARIDHLKAARSDRKVARRARLEAELLELTGTASMADARHLLDGGQPRRTPREVTLPAASGASRSGFSSTRITRVTSGGLPGLGKHS